MVHAMLSAIDDLCENNPNQKIHQIVSWLPHGQAFKIHDRNKFTNVVMPIWFMRLKYVSWVRQLNQYGFKTIQDGPDRGGMLEYGYFSGLMFMRLWIMLTYEISSSQTPTMTALYHKDFLRGEPELAQSIDKARRKGKGDSYNNQNDPTSISSPPSPRHIKNLAQPQDPAVSALCPSVSGDHGSRAMSSDAVCYLQNVVSNEELCQQQSSNIGVPFGFSSSFEKFADPMSQDHPVFIDGDAYSNMAMIHPSTTAPFVGSTPMGQPNSLVNLALPSFRMNPHRFAECRGVPSAYEPLSLDYFDPEPVVWENTMPALEERTSSYIASFF